MLAALTSRLGLGVISLGMIAAAFFLTAKLVDVTKEKNSAVAVGERLIRWADQTCEAAGVPFRPEGVKPDKWGEGCLARVRYLAGFERDAVRASNEAMREAVVEQQKKQAADAAAARKAEAKRRAAKKQMENVDAQVQNDEVGGDWFARLNQLGGLLRPDEGLRGPVGADRPGAADQGDAAGGPDRMPIAG